MKSRNKQIQNHLTAYVHQQWKLAGPDSKVFRTTGGFILYMGALAKQAYRSYLESDDWRALRLSILKQTKSTCCICLTASISNDVHHVCYAKNWNDVRAHHLVCLCRECHEDVHKWLACFPKPLTHAQSFKRWFLIRDILRMEKVMPYLMIESCSGIRALANVKPNHNEYRASIGLSRLRKCGANSSVFVDRFKDRRISKWFRSHLTTRREFIETMIQIGSGRLLESDAVEIAKKYLTEIRSGI